LFHIFPVSTVTQGIEILTGVRAGKQTPAGKFEANSVFGRVDARLRQMANTLSKFKS
jgi:hypothetical protein